MIVYTLLKGYTDDFDNQYFHVCGVFGNREDAEKEAEQLLTGIEDVEVIKKGAYTHYTETGYSYFVHYRVEAHVVK